MMALSGVRISWLILARKSDLADEARSAARLAVSSSSSAFFHCVMSRSTAQNFWPPSPSRPMVMNSGIRPPWRTRPITSRPSLSTLATPFRVQPVEIVERGALALGREQLGERAARHLVILVAEQRLGRAVERRARGRSRSTTITPSVAVSRIDLSSRVSASAARSARSDALRRSSASVRTSTSISALSPCHGTV